jgi:hypothetical protein
LNYHHKRKEARRDASGKRPLTDAEAEEGSSTSKLQKIDDQSGEKTEQGESATGKPVDEAEAWKDTGGDQPVKSRETEFQEYLNDLFI